MSDQRSIFISHPGRAAPFAAQAKGVFERFGFRVWVWNHDRPARGDLDKVFYRGIEGCYYFAHICTRDTRRSGGQEKERLFAKVLGKKPFVLLVFRQRFLLVFKRDVVPKDADDRAIYNEVSPKTFDEDCMNVAQRLLREQKLEHEPQQVDERRPIEPRFVDDKGIGSNTVAVEKSDST